MLKDWSRIVVVVTVLLAAFAKPHNKCPKNSQIK